MHLITYKDKHIPVMRRATIEIYKLSQRNRTLSQNSHANCHMKNNLPLIVTTTYSPGVSQTCYTCRNGRVRTLTTDSTYHSYRLHLQLTIKLQLMITCSENDQYLDYSIIAGKVLQIKNNESRPLRWKVKKPEL